MSSDTRPAQKKTEYKVKSEMFNLPAEEEWCSAVMGDPTGTWGATQSLVKPSEFLNERTRMIAESAEECMTVTPPKATSRANIAERLQMRGLLDDLMIKYLLKLHDNAFPTTIQDAQNNARKIRTHAERRTVVGKYRAAINEIESNPESYIKIVGETITATSDIIAHADDEYDPTSKAWYEQRSENDIVTPGAPSYLYRFNEWNLGILPATETAIHGPPKDGRKTTLVANILLKPLIDRVPITWITVDGQKDNVFDRFAAMLSVFWLFTQNEKDEEKCPRYIRHNNQDHYDQWEIKIRGVSKMWRSKQQNEAVEWARKTIFESNLHVYDVKSGILELPRILGYVQKDATMTFRDEPYRAFVVDYVQEIEAGGDSKSGWQHNDFEQVMKRCSAATKIYGLTSFYVSQPNEASLQGKGGKSSGAKGGGKLLQVVDTWLETEYDNENAPNKLGLIQKRARYGGFAREEYELHAPSGLILNPNAGKPIKYTPEGY